MKVTIAMKAKITEEYVHIPDLNWLPFPPALSEGGIRWKLLHVQPGHGAWTAIFDCPAGSSFAPHIHAGPGEYFLTKGRMRRLPKTGDKMKIEASVLFGDEDEEVEVHGESDCWDFGRG